MYHVPDYMYRCERAGICNNIEEKEYEGGEGEGEEREGGGAGGRGEGGEEK